jgi:hypothetical protein
MSRLDDALAPARALGPQGLVPYPTGQGRRVEADGYLYMAPSAATLIGQSGLGMDVRVLAGVMASEAGSLPTTYRYAIGETVLNECRAKGYTTLRRVTGDGKKQGHFGEQSGRWCASSRNPTRADVAIAQAVVATYNLNVTRGARRWVSLKVMDGGYQRGKPLAYNALSLLKKWGDEGWQWVGPIVDDRGVELIDPWLQCHLALVGKGKVDHDRHERLVAYGRSKGSALAVSDEASSDFDDGAPVVRVGAFAALAAALGLPNLWRK